jgi:hypothetical protein
MAKMDWGVTHDYNQHCEPAPFCGAFLEVLRLEQGHMRMILIGAILLGCFLVLDTFIRLKLKSAGRKMVFLRGGTLDYGEYLRARVEHGWPAWPVYLMWFVFVFGLVLIAAGLVLRRH